LNHHLRAATRIAGRARTWISLVLIVLLVQPAAADTSIAEERNLGRKFDMEARARLPLINDIEVIGYVDRIGQKIVGSLDTQPFAYHFAVVRDARTNAFAVPGGYVYVHAGLLTRAGSDDEVAAVLGHEIAHINGHHLVRQQEATALLNYATLLGVLLSAIQPMAGIGALALNSATQLEYRREYEQEADYLGARYMQKAGYDAQGMLDFFKKLLDEQRAGPATAPPYLLSHPLTEQRLTSLEAVLRAHNKPRRASPGPSLELERVQLLTRARSQQAQDVTSFYRRRLATDPGDVRARYLLGCAFLETGAYEAARDTLAGVPKAELPASERELGRTALALRDYSTARELLQRAVVAQPDDPLARFELAKTLQALNEPTAAIVAYERALQLAPRLEEAHYNLGILAGRAGREADGYFHLGMAYYLRGEHEKALSQLDKALPLLPTTDPRRTAAEEATAALRDYLGR